MSVTLWNSRLDNYSIVYAFFAYLKEQGYGVTSLVELGLPVTMADLDIALKKTFGEIFGPIDAALTEKEPDGP